MTESGWRQKLNSFFPPPFTDYLSLPPLHSQIHGVYDDDVEHQPPALPAPSWPPCSQQEEHQDNGVGKESGGVPAIQDDAGVVQPTLLELVQTSQIGVGQVGHQREVGEEDLVEKM